MYVILYTFYIKIKFNWFYKALLIRNLFGTNIHIFTNPIDLKRYKN